MCTTTIAVSELHMQSCDVDKIENNCKISKKNVNPQVECEFCKKLISKNNITTHLKRCTIKKHEESKIDPTEFLETIKNQNDQIKKYLEQISLLKKELEMTNKRVEDSDAKYNKLLTHIVVLKPTGVNLDMSPI